MHHFIIIWVKSRNCGCLVTWFCYQLIAKPGNKTATVSWPDPYVNSNWSYSPEMVKLGCDLCDLDLWPWRFAWTLLWSLVITPENFMMIRWCEHSQNGVTDRRTDRQTVTDEQTENTICRAAWSQLKITKNKRELTCRERHLVRSHRSRCAGK